ncbi:hypothetical protein ABIE26_004486 [Pedobacter africanus]|uniref:Uncharacterized protein n=1 Tax=Pedobacter africanus TaxID=151894 RepID=A0ACC6L3V7_9SPHI|nr:hypothetical protein [Pedobacter africanus]MDR6786044.1 hypothetical protein [Pedobacter africanus]
MKHKIFTLVFLSAFVVLNISCSKKELAQPDPDKVIKLQIRGSSDVDLEYVYKDSVIATSLITSGKNISIDTRLLIKEEGATFQIRKKGSSEILQTKQLSSSPFIQNFTVFYDGIKVYDQAISLLIKGYALTGELEFLLDGNIILSKGGAVDSRSSILIDKGTSREIQIRKKGETTVLLKKTIESDIQQQNISFFFDGIKIVDNVQLDPPTNPANMMVRAKFETSFPNQFKKVDVDLVFYTRLKTASNTTVGTKVIPEIRFTLPKDGSFNSIELPPLPGPEYIYSFDIYEKGTNIEPYNPGSPLTLTGYTIKPNEGRVTSAYVDYPENRINFQAGKSNLLIFTDARILAVVAGTRSVFISGGKVTDLSQYFQ